MTDEELVKLLKQEETAASSYQSSELAKAQQEGLDRFFGRPYGDELEGRSKVVSHDVEDTVNWIMPDLMRTFTASEDLVSIKAQTPEDDQQYQGAPEGKSKADVMAAYLSHIFFEDNPGAENVYDFLFDGLLQRQGILYVPWKDPEPQPPVLIEGVGEQQVFKYLNDPEYEILGFEEEQREDGFYFVLEVQRTPKMGRVHIEPVPPEEFAVHKLARNLATAKYHRRKSRAYVSELAKQFPDHAEALKAKRSNNGEDTDGRRSARFPDDNVTLGDIASNEGRAECDLLHEYIRVDFDGDGTVELRQIKRVDDVILENVVVVSSDYKCWTPSRVSHRIAGRSIPDMLADITKIRTVITRHYLDGLSGTLSPRTYYNKTVIDQDGLDAIIANEQGATVGIKGNPADAIYEAVSPDISAPALQGLEYFDQRGAEATGVTKQAQGMDPQAMNKTATGIDLLQAAAKTRVEMIARWAGTALEDVFKHILRHVAAHQDGPRQVKLFGKWCEIDPRTWSDEICVKIDVGSAGVSKQQRIANLSLIAAKQEQMLVTAGPTPMVQLQHLRNAYASLTSEMGFPDTTLYFGEIPQDWQPEPRPDPKQMEVEGKMQLEQGKAQIQAQVDQQRMMHDREKAAADMQLARDKAAAELQLAREKAAAEIELAREKAAMERELAIEKLRIESDLAERNSQRQHAVAMKSAEMKGMNGSGVSSNRPGGSLAQ